MSQSGYFHAEHTIIAAGAWSGISRHWTPDLVPIRPIKGQRILIRKSGFVPKSWIQSLVPQKDGTILSAATREEGVFNKPILSSNKYSPVKIDCLDSYKLKKFK